MNHAVLVGLQYVRNHVAGGGFAIGTGDDDDLFFYPGGQFLEYAGIQPARPPPGQHRALIAELAADPYDDFGYCDSQNGSQHVIPIPSLY